MKATGLVFKSRDYVGSVEPPATVLEDESRFGSNGAFRADGQPNWVKEPSGLWVLDFNSATPDYIEIPAAYTQLNFTSEDFSIIMGVYFDVVDVSSRLFNRGEDNTDGYWLRIYSDAWFGFYTAQSGVQQVTYSAPYEVSIHTWYILGISRSGASVILYKDGIAPSQTGATHIDPATCARSAKIGIRDNKVWSPFDGKIGYIAIWNYALSAEQHASIYQATRHWFGV